MRVCVLRNARGIKGRLKKNAESGAFTNAGRVSNISVVHLSGHVYVNHGN